MASNIIFVKYIFNQSVKFCGNPQRSGTKHPFYKSNVYESKASQHGKGDAMTVINRLSANAYIVLAVFMMGMIIMSPYSGFAQQFVNAPDFPEDVDWINTSRPLTMQELRGRAVLLDFWTYCCINCMHVLPDLARLEKKYGERLVVVGVHSAKFDGESDTDNIGDAVRRYKIHHPVINDSEFVLWKAYGVRAWPTLVLIGPEGKVVGRVSGEGNYNVLDHAIGKVLNDHKATDDGLPLLPISDAAVHDDGPGQILYYPGKVLADNSSGRLFVSDSGHNRIIIMNKDTGEILQTIGSGAEEFRDGSFTTASFSNPQGMVLHGSDLYIADTGNHAIRKVDFNERSVVTVAGTGRQAMWGAKGGPAMKTNLSSPWDMVLIDGKLYIAMAGPHQLWVYDPRSETVDVFAGNGRENITDGSLGKAELAQPSGITTDGVNLYFADSETSSIRMVNMAEKRVVTLIGTGLFDFGYRDGKLDRALLQHPLGIAWADGSLWVADTYNNRIRRIDISQGTISTVAGGEKDGMDDGIGLSSRFDEPGGLSASDGQLYIADTNNHAVRAYDPSTAEVTTIEPVPVFRIAGDQGTLSVSITPPPGYKITLDSPSALRSHVAGDGRKRNLDVDVRIDTAALDATVHVAGAGDGERIEFGGELYVCDDDARENAACYLREYAFAGILRSGDVDVSDGRFEYTVTPP